MRLPDHNLKFMYYDLPRPWHEVETMVDLRSIMRSGSGGPRASRERCMRAMPFDRVHHVTWAGCVCRALWGSLGIPFVTGPVGGGERAPSSLWSGYGLYGRLLHLLRHVANAAIRFNPLILRCVAQATTIYVTSRDTLALLPPEHRAKAIIELNIGSSEDDDGDRDVIDPR